MQKVTRHDAPNRRRCTTEGHGRFASVGLIILWRGEWGGELTRNRLPQTELRRCITAGLWIIGEQPKSASQQQRSFTWSLARI